VTSSGKPSEDLEQMYFGPARVRVREILPINEKDVHDAKVERSR